MNVQADISLYPLRTDHLGHAIKTFLDEMTAGGLTVQPGKMSSMVAGEVDTVFSSLAAAFKAAAENGQVVLVTKVSNACPPGEATEGTNADAG